MSEQQAKVISSGPLNTQDAKWLSLTKLTYQDNAGTHRTWESLSRKTRPSSSSVDAVHIIALIQRPTGPELLLERQFRPPLDKICIELPAGLIDANETAEECAVRELREETGYIGEAAGTTPVMFGAPGFSNSCSVMVHVKVDMEKEENQNPKPQLEDGEFIQCFTVPVKDLYEQRTKWEREGLAVDGKLGSLIEGLEMSNMWMKT